MDSLTFPLDALLSDSYRVCILLSGGCLSVQLAVTPLCRHASRRSRFSLDGDSAMVFFLYSSTHSARSASRTAEFSNVLTVCRRKPQSLSLSFSSGNVALDLSALIQQYLPISGEESEIPSQRQILTFVQRTVNKSVLLGAKTHLFATLLLYFFSSTRAACLSFHCSVRLPGRSTLVHSSLL